MESSLDGFLPHLAALLIGGLGGSLGLTFGARTKRAQAVLLRVSVLAMGVASVVTVGIGLYTLYRVGGSLLQTASVDLAGVSVPLVFALGLSVGLPLGVPGLLAAWSEARGQAREQAKKRAFVPTKDDRRAYAAQIVKQIIDASPRPREVAAKIAGDGGTVLRFEGDIDATEGERLTAALRADLKDVGFKRVEGLRGTKEWWARV